MSFAQDIRDSARPALGYVAMGIVWAAFAAQVPVLKAQVNASDSVFGVIFLVSSLGAMAAMWLAPRVDRMFGAASMAVTSAALAVTYVLTGLTGSAIVFTAVLLVIAGASGVLDVLMNARISEIEARTRRPLMNLNHAIFSFSYCGAAVATGFAREAGWSPTLVFTICAVVILAMCPFMIVPHRPLSEEAEPDKKTGMGIIVWLIGFVVLAGLFAEQSVEGWSALHLERTLGGAASAGAMGPAVLGLTMGIGRLSGQVLVRYTSDTVLIGLACLLSAAGVAMAALAQTLLVAYLGFGMAGLGISVVVPLAMAMVGRSVPERRRVAAIGQASIIGYVAFLIGPLAMGVTSDMFGLPAAFLLVGAVLVAVAFGLVPLIARRLALSE